MPLRVRILDAPGASLGYSIERLSDGLHFDFAAVGATAGTFTAVPAEPIRNLTAETGRFLGRFSHTLLETPTTLFPDGAYCLTIHDRAMGDASVGLLGVRMTHGDDEPTTVAGVASDPWAAPLPGNYDAGTAGAILSEFLDAPVSSRSTFDGGTVQSVAQPVIVGVNQDKAGYSLSAAGLDAVPVEAEVNARQALAPILAAAAGTVSGAGTGSIVIKGGNSEATRILAATDAEGNRSAVTLLLPP